MKQTVSIFATKHRCLVFAVLITVSLAGPGVAALLGTAFTYQGMLNDAGAPATGTYDFVFRLFDNEIAGSQVGIDQNHDDVQVDDGQFKVELDFGVAFDGTELWLEIEVEGTVLGGRQLLSPVPYALHAASVAADSLDFSDMADALTMDSSTSIDLDTNGADLNVDGDTLFVDSSADRVGVGTPMPAATLDVAGDLRASGTTATGALTIGGLDCSANANGGALTAGAGGVVTCSDDDAGSAGNTLDAAYNQGGAGAGGTITADSGPVTVEGADGLRLHTGSLEQTPGNPELAGLVGVSSGSYGMFVSGRYAYVGGSQLRVIDVSDPSSPSQVGSVGISAPIIIHVSGRYLYSAGWGSNVFEVVDVSNPYAPVVTGSLSTGLCSPTSVHVSGRYAYVPCGAELKVIDVSDPYEPSQVGSMTVSPQGWSVQVSGRYAYLTCPGGPGQLKVIDVSDPSSPIEVGNVSEGGTLRFVKVSGRYAYVVNMNQGELKVFDVSRPDLPAVAASLSIGGEPYALFVAGRYVYVVDAVSEALKVIDVSDPSSPSLVGSLTVGERPRTVFVSGRYVYVTDVNSPDLRVIDVSGAELTSLMAHSLEAGQLQVRNDIIAQGQVQISGGLAVGAGGVYSDGNVGVSGTIALANDVVPTSSPSNLVQLFAQDVSSSSELRVRDESNTVTTLSPHNFSLIGAPSEPMAWSFYSENQHGKINVDMLKAMRLVEALAGEQLVHIQSHDKIAEPEDADLPAESLWEQVESLRQENRDLRSELGRIKQALGID